MWPHLLYMFDRMITMIFVLCFGGNKAKHANLDDGFVCTFTGSSMEVTFTDL